MAHSLQPWWKAVPFSRYHEQSSYIRLWSAADEQSHQLQDKQKNWKATYSAAIPLLLSGGMPPGRLFKPLSSHTEGIAAVLGATYIEER